MYEFAISTLSNMYPFINDCSDKERKLIKTKSTAFNIPTLLNQIYLFKKILSDAKSLINQEVFRIDQNSKQEEREPVLIAYRNDKQAYNLVLEEIKRIEKEIDNEWTKILELRAFLPIYVDNYSKYHHAIEWAKEKSVFIHLFDYEIIQINENNHNHIAHAINISKTPNEALENISKLFQGDDFDDSNSAILYYEEKYENFIFLPSKKNQKILIALEEDAKWIESDQHWVVGNNFLNKNIELITSSLSLLINTNSMVCISNNDISFIDNAKQITNSKFLTKPFHASETNFSYIKPFLTPLYINDFNWLEKTLINHGFNVSTNSLKIWDYDQNYSELDLLNSERFIKIKKQKMVFFGSLALVQFKQKNTGSTIRKKQTEYAIIDTTSLKVIGHSPYLDVYFLNYVITLFSNGLKTIDMNRLFSFIEEE